MDQPQHRRPSRRAHRTPLPPTPIAVSAAGALGWTRAARRHAVLFGDLEGLGRGVVAEPPMADVTAPTRQQAEAAVLRAARASALRCPRARISHFPAAIALGIPTFGNLSRPCLTVPSGTALRHLADAHLHRATLGPGDLIGLDGYQVTCPARTVMDVAREHGVDAGVVAADYALHEGLLSLDDLAAAYDLCAGWPGRRAARSTLLVADAAAESPLESLSRLRIGRHGLPPPRLQPEICDLDGNYITRSDFLWEEFGVVGEADGMLKYTRGAKPDGERALVEREVQTALEATGLIVVRWGWADVFNFGPVVSRVQLGFARGARPGSPQRRWGILTPRPGLHP